MEFYLFVLIYVCIGGPLASFMCIFYLGIKALEWAQGKFTQISKYFIKVFML